MDLDPIRGESFGEVPAGDEARSYVTRTFGWMFVGLTLTALVAAWFAGNGTVEYFEDHLGVFIGLLVAEFALMLVIGLGLRRIGTQTAVFVYCLWSGVNGALFSVVFSAYTSAEVAPAFLAAALMFGAAALYGYRTRRDLTGQGSLLLMGLAGVLFATLLNAIFASGALSWLVTFGGVAIFVGMTAVVVQELKRFGAERSGAEADNMAVFGALLLNLGFLSVLLYLLRYMQGRS